MTAPSPRHPAKFSEPIIDRLARMVAAEARAIAAPGAGRFRVDVLDPFAGVGRVHQLARAPRGTRPAIVTTGVEIEAEWAACHPDTVHADFLAWGAGRSAGIKLGTAWPFDIVVSSPTYGNRFSDHHDARDGSTRRSYTHDLGHALRPNNTGAMPWGTAYRSLHARVVAVLWDVLSPGGAAFWNVSDFYKGDRLIPVVEFHRGLFLGAGFVEDGRDAKVVTPRLMGVGTAATAKRADYEVIMRFRKPGGS